MISELKTPLTQRWHFWVLFLPALLIGQTACLFFQKHEHPGFQKGMAFPTWAAEEYCSYNSDQSLTILANTTCTEWVQLVPTWYQEDRFSSEMFPEYEGKTATNECLKHAVRTAHSLGLKVMLKPHIDAFSSDWRGTFQPSNPEVWFDNYNQMIKSYAQLAQEEDVEIFSIGCEFLELTKPEFTAAWLQVIQTVRQYYHGPLVYSANWWQEYEQVEFWASLDFIGIDAYFKLTNKPDPTLAELLTAWRPYVARIETFYERWRIPVILTEIGYRSIDGANMRPWDWETPGVVDLTEQALCYQAVKDIFGEKPWFEGIYWWNWEPNPSRGGPSDKGYTPYGKPAEKNLREWYCETTSLKKGRRNY
jgi:hypothetical protein